MRHTTLSFLLIFLLPRSRFCRGGVVVVNCEGGGLLVTGYDAPTLERRGQVVWRNICFTKMEKSRRIKTVKWWAGLHHPNKISQKFKEIKKNQNWKLEQQTVFKKRHSTNVSVWHVSHTFSFWVSNPVYTTFIWALRAEIKQPSPHIFPFVQNCFILFCWNTHEHLNLDMEQV